MKNDPAGNNLEIAHKTPAESAWGRFWFTPIPTTGLHALRVLSGVLFLCWLLTFLGHQEAFFSLNGWFDREAYEELGAQMRSQPNLAPSPLGWSVLYLAGDSSGTFQAMYWGSIAVLALFTLGVATRITAVLTWVVIVSFLANPATNYDGDFLLSILAFYLMFGYLLLGQWNGNLTILERVFGSRRDFLLGRWLFARAAEARPLSYAANLALRLLQIHLAIIMVTNGVDKLQKGDWWAGVALWYPLHPPFQTTMESLQHEMPGMANSLFVQSLAQYLVLGWQIGFPVFAWRKGGWRVLLLGGAAIYWLGVFFLFKLPLFGPFVMLGCLSYLRPEEWARLRQFVKSWVGSPATVAAEPAAKKQPVIAGKENIKK